MSESTFEFSEQEILELEELYRNKIDINDRQRTTFEEFFFLTEFQKKSLAEYIKKYFPLQSIYELQYILGFTQETAKLMALVCSIEPYKKKYTIRELVTQGTHELSSLQSWYPVNQFDYYSYFNYTGMPLKTVHRYRYSAYNKIEWGITLKNDMGEPTQKGPISSSYDYTSAFIQIKDIGMFSNICVGDYELKIGQGLTSWQGGFYGKYMGMSPQKNQAIIRKHSSSNEFTFNRGAACSFSINSFQITPFVSYKKLDGLFSNDNWYMPIQINETGYHRTSSEIETQHNLQSVKQGIVLSQTKNHFQKNIAYIRNTVWDTVQTYTLQNGSFSYNFSKQDWNLYGETAIDNYGQTANIHGISYQIFESITANVAVRKYGRNYQSLMSSAFTEQTSVQDEKGLYSSLEFKQGKYSGILAHDRFKTSEKYGTDTYLRTSYTNFETWKIDIQTSYNTKLELEKRIIFKCNNYYNYSPRIMLKTTYQIGKNTNDTLKSHGYMLSQSMQFQINKKLSCNITYMTFDAPYELRIYAWLPNVRYANSSSQVLYKGKSYIFNASTSLTGRTKIQCRFQYISYTNPHELPDYYKIFGHSKKLSIDCILICTF